MVGHIKELLGLLEFHPPFGHFEFARRLGSTWASMFYVEAFALSNSNFFRPLVKFPWENNLRKLPVNAELLEFVIKCRSANHSWRPSSKAAPKKRMKISQSPQAVCSSTGLLERWTHVGGDGFYTAVEESWKYDLEARCGWGQRRLHREESREGRALFCTCR